MRVSFKDNTLKVVTSISKATIEKGIAKLTAKDEKGNDVYRVGVSNSGNGSLDLNGMVVNAFIEDEAAVVIVLPMNTTQEDVERYYGEALIAAEKYTAQITTAASEKEATIAAFFVADAE